MELPVFACTPASKEIEVFLCANSLKQLCLSVREECLGSTSGMGQFDSGVCSGRA
jgi:hypothetical protein